MLEWILKKSENKNTTNKYRYFFKSNFAGVNRLFMSVYSNKDDNAKPMLTYLKLLLIIITSSSMEKTFMINPLILIYKDMNR